MRNRRRYGRRGLSTVITTLLMVAAVSIMGSALMTWTNQSFANKQLEISNQTDSRINLIRENLVLEDVWFYQNQTGFHFANVTIRNTGEIALTVSKVYVNNTEIQDFEPLIILADGIDEICIQFDWLPDRPQSIWIHTARGTDVKQTWKS